jgi:hypothetical protein
MGLPIHIEGYGPPNDPRMNVIRVAPDPGVIEVNIHPAHSWDDCVATTEAIYEEARACRLGADKFMIDGKHTGTGGGNHVVVGGRLDERQPVPAPPDVLKSLILMWQRHPSLSYLFSGLFIGPTSQAPRIDEARTTRSTSWRSRWRRSRNRARRRCAVAVAGGPALAQHADGCDRQHPPGRDLYRQALLAGRPDRPAGPGGVPRLRDAAASAHEPCAATAVACHRRAGLAGADRGAAAVRWGTVLHDRFMLPHFLWEDFLTVLRDLGEHGFEMRSGLVRGAGGVPVSLLRRGRGGGRAP